MKILRSYIAFITCARRTRLSGFAWLFSFAVLTAASCPAVSPPSECAAKGVATGGSPPSPESWNRFGSNFLHDQKRLWLFPQSLARGKHWLPTAGFVLATGGLVALDPHDDPHFGQTQTFHQFNRLLSGNNTGAGMVLLPLSVYLLGHVRRDSYARQTVQLAAEAVLDAEMPALVARDISRRLRPAEVPPNGDFRDTWFRRNKGLFYLGPGGFPSGHTVAAFSIATVFAERYHRHRWVPWAAYGLAGLVGFSRITLQAHFPSDVFAGAVIGYTISHYIVLRRS